MKNNVYTITHQNTLNETQKQFVFQQWNDTYPNQLAFKSMEGLDAFLNPLGDQHHYFCLNDKNELLGWSITFIRDQQRWFSVIVAAHTQHLGVGKSLMERLKKDFNTLNGWVIDHDNYVRNNGSPYPSPLEFYLKLNFVIVPWKRLELPHLSAVQIQLKTENKLEVLETERFVLREMTMHDAENAYLLNLDPDVVKYTGDHAFQSIEEARTFLANYKHYMKYGFGRWAVIDKSTHAYLGWCGLKYHEDKKEIDLGYRFFKKYWGQGIATETAQACLNYGFHQLHMPCIVANAMKANPASVRVMHKIGMTFKHENTCGDEPGVQYIIYPQE